MTERSYSYSQIQAAYKCLAFFKMLYVDKLSPPVPQSGDMNFGTAIHAGIQAILEGDDGMSVFNTYWESEKEQERKYSRNDWDALKSQGEVLLTRFERLHAKKYKIHKMEERIFTEFEGVRLEGTPDFVGEYEGVPSIVDFKTAAYRYPMEKLVCNEQLVLYKKMAREAWGYDAKQIVYVVLIKGREPSIQVLKRDVPQEEEDQTLSNLLAVCKELDKRQEWHQNRASCIIGSNRCDFFSRCFGNKDG